MMKTFALVLALLFSSPVLAQRAEIDSLLGILNEPRPDTAQVELLADLSFAYYGFAPDSGTLYGERALALAEKAGFRKGEGWAYNALGANCHVQGLFPCALKNYRKALEIQEAVGNRRGMAALYGNIGSIHRYRGEYDRALESHLEALEIKKAFGDSSGMAVSQRSIGILYEAQGDYARALEFYRKALEIQKDADDRNGMAYSLLSIGGIHLSRGAYPRALEHYRQALEIRADMGDQRGAAEAHGSIGNVYKYQKEYDLALERYRKALEIHQNLGDRSSMSVSYNNIGIVYNMQGDPARALEYYRKSLEIDEALGDRRGTAITCNNIGGLFTAQSRYDSAEAYRSRALSLAREIGAPSTEGYALNGLADNELAQGRPESALSYARQGLEIARAVGEQELVKDCAATLHQAAAALGRYQEAYQAHVAYKAAADSLFNEEQTKKLTRMEAEYEYAREKERAEAEREQERALEQAKLNNQQRLTFAVAAGLLLATLLALLAFRQSSLRRKANAELIEKNEEIRQQSEELAAQRDQLIELDGFKQAMTGMIVHDLKNPLNAVIAFSSGKAEREWKRVRQAGQQMLNLVLNILDVQKFEEAEVALDLAEAPARDIVAEALRQVDLLAEQKSIVLHNEIPVDLGAKMDREMTVRVFVNLLTNAIKYTPNGGSVTLSGEQIDRMARLRVTDTGVGIPADKLATVFDKFSQVQARKSGAARSTGLGLTFCKMVAEASGGKIGVEAEEGKGASFWLDLPLAEGSVKAEETASATPQPEALPSLTPEDEERIGEALAHLRSLEVYQVSDVRKTLGSISTDGDPRLTEWKEALNEAVFTLNEAKYVALLKPAGNDAKA